MTVLSLRLSASLLDSLRCF